jgi:hypothetical protein
MSSLSKLWVAVHLLRDVVHNCSPPAIITPARRQGIQAECGTSHVGCCHRWSDAAGMWSCNASVTCWPSWHLTPQRLWGIRCVEPSRQRSAPQHPFWMFRYKHGHIASKVPQRLGSYSAHGASLHAGHVGLYSPDRCGHLWQRATRRACGNTHHATRKDCSPRASVIAFGSLIVGVAGWRVESAIPHFPAILLSHPLRQRRGQCVRYPGAGEPHHHRPVPRHPCDRRLPALPPGRAPLRRGGGRADLLRRHHQAVGAERAATACPGPGGWQSWVWARRLGC